MRNIRHDNLAQFMGACVDIPNICILFQYCPKGSLQVIHFTLYNLLCKTRALIGLELSSIRVQTDV